MNFIDDLQRHIDLLEKQPGFYNDNALRMVVELLKDVTSQDDLQKQSNLINRIAVDSIESWDTIKLISTFMTTYTHKK